MHGIVLHSGGLDSTTALALAIGECDVVTCLSLRYGQKHSREIEAAEQVAKRFGVEQIVIQLPDVFQGFGSTLVDADIPNPHLSYEEIREAEGPSPSYVPFRNANFLSVAVSLAMVKDAGYVYFAAHADDAHNWAYPDTTPEFIGAMSNAIMVGTYNQVRLRTPLMWLSKRDVVVMAASLQAPVELTYSCYEGREAHCGLCPTCINRIEAFKGAGFIDPVSYELEVDWGPGVKPWEVD